MIRSQGGQGAAQSIHVHRTGLDKESRGQGAAPPIRVRETNSKDKRRYMSVLVRRTGREVSLLGSNLTEVTIMKSLGPDRNTALLQATGLRTVILPLDWSGV